MLHSLLSIIVCIVVQKTRVGRVALVSFKLRIVSYESLHCFVASQSKAVVEFGSGVVAVFGTLPEQALVVAEERCALHLRRVLEDTVALAAKLLWRHRHAHLDVRAYVA